MCFTGTTTNQFRPGSQVNPPPMLMPGSQAEKKYPHIHSHGPHLPGSSRHMTEVHDPHLPGLSRHTTEVHDPHLPGSSRHTTEVHDPHLPGSSRHTTEVHDPHLPGSSRHTTDIHDPHLPGSSRHTCTHTANSSPSSSPGNNRYSPHNVRRRELRSKKKIDKLAKDCRTLQKKIKELGCEKEKLAKSNTTLRVQVCSLTRRLRQKE